MCGIAGILSHGLSAAAAAERTHRMVATLAHRGPDDDGLAGGPGWSVGMRRLAIQDPTPAGAQPMTRDGLTIVFNGEVYNFRELRRELERGGAAFASGCDTEVVLAAFQRWGTGALPRFNGMFALVVVDEPRRRALVARDRFGEKPLFLARSRAGLAFASELKAFVAADRDRLSIDADALAAYFRFQYVPAPRTIYRGVSKLPPASWQEIDLDSGTAGPVTSYWSLPHAGGTPATPGELRETVRQAVRARLVADVPLGAFLSGGTDSSMVVSCMRELCSDVRTFSIGFADPRFDESRHAQAVAEHLGTRHTHRRLEWTDAMGLVPALADAYDEPFADSSAIPLLAVSRLARESVTVALSGDGGDELFGGYTRYRAHRAVSVAARMPPAAAEPLSRMRLRGAAGRRLRLLGSVASGGDERCAYREELVSAWRSPELRRLVPGASDADGGFCPSYGAAAGPVERMMRCDLGTYLIDDILQKVDRASMAASLEARVPMLDPDVVATALRSAGPAERRPGEKPLLRDALRLALPDELVDRPKQGFALPISSWMRDGLRPMLEDLVLGRERTDYDLHVARDVCTRYLAGADEATPQVWSLLVYELWRERWHA
jgi:asparagine synthase (glutamine-hydrolysing)